MNILYLIGNGFDLNLGLKTKLSHVAEKIIGEEVEDSDIIKLQENLKKNKNLWWSDFEFQLGVHTKEFDPETISNYDNQYNHFVKIIKDLFERQERRIDYKENTSFIATSFLKHLTTFYNYLPDTRKKSVLTFLENIAMDEGINYNFITFNYTSVLDNFVKCCVNEYDTKKYSNQLPLKSPRTVFHYLQKIVHIHGTLEDGLILGVDNSEQIANKQLADNKSFLPRIIKRETIEALGRNSANEAMALIDSSNIIISFGLSIGVTDKFWWNYIIDWLCKSTERQFILFVYDDKMDSTLNLTKLNTIENARTKLISVLDSSVQAEYSTCSGRLHFIFEQKNMFRIENIFYSEKSKPSYNTGGLYRQALKNISPKEFDRVSKAIKNVTPEAIKHLNDFMRKLP